MAATLSALHVDTVVIGGASTSGCIRAGAIDAPQHGLRPLVVRQACGDRISEFHEANLHDLDIKHADVFGLADARGRFADS